MARWRLTAAHYLLIPGTKYRYEETDRETGEVNRQEFDVGRLLDPNNPKDCRSAGSCIVSNAEKPLPGDWPYKGEPTPDMEPLDEEAADISATLRAKWEHPIDSLPVQGANYSEALLERLEKALQVAMTNSPDIAVSQPQSGVPLEDFKALQEQVAALIARNSELESAQVKRRA